MWSPRRPMRNLPRLTPSPAQQRIRQLAREHDGWVARLAEKYSLPRSELLRMLDRPGQLEDEIATLLIDSARNTAAALFHANEGAPKGNDPPSRAVRGVLSTLNAAKEAEAKAEQQKRWADTDTYLKQLREE